MGKRWSHATIHQLVRKGRQTIEQKSDAPALKNHLKREGFAQEYTTTLKPNPALRKVARVRLTMALRLLPIYLVLVITYKNTLCIGSRQGKDIPV